MILSTVFQRVRYGASLLQYLNSYFKWNISFETYPMYSRPVGRGGGCMCTPFWTEIYKQQYEYRCPQGSHQPNLRLLATH